MNTKKKEYIHALRYSILYLIFLSFATLSACGIKEREPITKTGFFFDTVVQITLYDDTKEPLIDDCFAMAGRYEHLFSKTIEGSDVYKLNHAEGNAVTVSEDTISLLHIGLSYCEKSGGSFDITIGALTELWDIANNPGIIPTEAEITEALSGISYKSISINDREVTLTNPDTMLDLGGIAKGYIADRMKEYLNENGVCEGYINLGGNLLMLGPKSDGKPYVIGIQRPFSPDGTPMFTLDVTEGTVVTSGIYERYFEKDGRIYHHILNPSDGYPYDNGLVSVTILCPNSVDGDALSTACFSLGPKAGLTLIEELPDTEAIFITEDYELLTSSGVGTTVPYTLPEVSENAGNP